MVINSKAYGKIGVDEKQIFHFKEGILGFESMKDYALIDAGQPPFMWLQSIELQELAFVVLDPSIFRDDYDPKVDSEDLLKIEAEDFENILTLSIITIPENQNDMTANLQGPILLNKKALLGKQYISTDDRWTTRHRVMDELAGKREVPC